MKRFLTFILVILAVPGIGVLVMWAEYGREDWAFASDADVRTSPLAILFLERNLFVFASSSWLTRWDNRSAHWAGMSLIFEKGDPGETTLFFSAPAGRLAAATTPPLLLLTLMATRTTLRRRRLRGDRCKVCGYDLRATPERCPECGTLKR